LAFWVSLALFSLLVALSAARDGVNAIQSWRASRR
jgi:hypothetical protein